MSARPSPGEAQLTWLGHSTVVIDLPGARVVTDPLLGAHAGPLRRRGATPRGASWQGAEAVLLSHLHHDHADLPSLHRLGRVPVISAEPNAAWLRRKLLDGVACDDHWQALGASGCEVRLTRADHSSRRMPHRPNAAHGQLIRAGGLSVWIAGDTSLYDDMADIPRMVGRDHVDVALLPIGGWGPRLSAGHMGPEEAAQAAAMTGARCVLPVHWGTFSPPFMAVGGWMDRPLAAFEGALQRRAPGCELLRVQPGQRVRVTGA